MTEPTKYHIVLSNGTELFNAVYWLDSTSRPYSGVPPISYDPKLECLLSTDDGYVVVGKSYIVLRETMESYQKRNTERGKKLIEIQEFERRTRQDYEDIFRR